MARKIWLLIDGLPYWLISHWPEGSASIPFLTRMLQEGRLARLGPAEPNCQTPPSLATLYSGMSAAELGITGYDVPVFSRADQPQAIGAFKQGIAGRPPWIWTHEALSAEPVRLCHIPFVNREELGARLEVASFGFVAPLFPPHVVPLGNARSHVLAQFPQGHMSATARHGGVTVEMQSAEGTAEYHVPMGKMLRVPLRGGSADTAVLMEVIDAVPTAVVLGAWIPEYSGSEQAVAAHQSAVRSHPYFAASLTRDYRAGRLGRTLMDEGDGSAERLLTRALDLMARRYYEEALAIIEAGPTGLFMAYQPCIDLALHELTGYVDPACRHYTPSRSEIASRLILDLLQPLDRFLERVSKAVSTQDLVLMSSDHGMASMDTIVYPNCALERRNWLVRRTDGTLDPQASICYYHPAENGVLIFNINTLSDRNMSIAAVLHTLSADLQAETGRPVHILEWDNGPHAPPPFTARHYLWPGERCQAKADLKAELSAPSRKTGDHCVAGLTPQLCGVVGDLTGSLCADKERNDWFKSGLIPAQAVSSLLLPKEKCASPHYS